MSIAGQSYVAALIQAGDHKIFLKHGKIKHLFRSESDQKLFAFVDKHVRDYHKLPDLQTVLTAAKIEIPEKVVEPAEYYLDLLKRAYVEVSIREAGAKAAKYLTGDTKNPEAALKELRTGVSDIDAHQMAPFVTDYRESGPVLIEAYKQKLLSGADSGLKFGWPTLDAMAGGIEEGDVVSWVGKEGLGKTWVLLWQALSVWKQHRPILFVSMEIKPKPVLQRISAIDIKKPFGGIVNGSLTTTALAAWKTALNALPDRPYPFWVVDGNLQANVSDIEALALQLKPRLIVLDGAYLMKHPSERDRYRRVAENMDLIKQDLAPIAPVICSWQFANSETKKLKKGDKPALEHIGYSAAIGQHSSLVLGLFQTDSIETEIRREVSVLKGRNGEAGSFHIKWDFTHTTDFSECSPETLEDLQF